jgi:hypothetical protein
MKITKQMLNRISDIAKANYINDGNSELSASELISASWIKAVMGELAKEVNIELPERKSQESVFED